MTGNDDYFEWLYLKNSKPKSPKQITETQRIDELIKMKRTEVVDFLKNKYPEEFI